MKYLAVYVFGLPQKLTPVRKTRILFQRRFCSAVELPTVHRCPGVRLLSAHPSSSDNDHLSQVAHGPRAALEMQRLSAAACAHPSHLLFRGCRLFRAVRERRAPRGTHLTSVPVPGASSAGPPPLAYSPTKPLTHTQQVFCYITAFALVFRTNTAYARYWEARLACATMASKWGDAAAMALVFDHRVSEADACEACDTSETLPSSPPNPTNHRTSRA